MNQDQKLTSHCHICGRYTRKPYATIPATFPYSREKGIRYPICSRLCLSKLPDKQEEDNRLTE